MPRYLPSSVLPPWSKSTVRSCARPGLALLALSSALALSGGTPLGSAEHALANPSAAVAIALGRQGLKATAKDIRWIDPPGSTGRYRNRFAALTQRGSEPHDVWFGFARLAPEGKFLGLSDLYNLSDSSAVSESGLVVGDRRIAWTVNDGDEVVAVKLAEMKGESLPPDELTWLERLQTRITFYQETGQFSGLCQRVYRFDQPRTDVALAFTKAGLVVESRGQSGVLRCDGAEAAQLGMTAEPSQLGSPGDLVTWAVDRVRALPWFGSDRMQWLKAVVFGLLDRLDTLKRRVITSDGAEQVASQVGDFLSQPGAMATNPTTGWPPPPMSPILSPPLQAEGVFRPLDDDPFALPPGGKASPFALAFLRPDSTRPESQVFVVVWDPRLVELHTMTGTREPKTATGETGLGMVPREDATIGRLAAAFNGGFQATHGEFGMMAQKVVYLPPKPFAATIAELVDGSVGFGTWPDDETIADEIVGFRQNLTPLVADEVVNPYGRTWWGGVPPGWQDATRTVRTGICLTKEHFVAYFYGSAISADHLAKAMVSARCSYGVHLDMNPGHTGFEFYRVQRAGTLPATSSKLDSTWQTRGSVAGTKDWEFLGRRMLRTMHLMHFPRYIRTDSRDFFYLTHRQVLPPKNGPAQESNVDASERDRWETETHRQHGFPAAMATRRLRPDPARPELEVAMVVLDGKWTTPCTSNCSGAKLIVRTGSSGASTGVGAYHFRRGFLVTEAMPPAGATPIAFGRSEERAGKSVAAMGVAGREWLIYAEVVRGGDRHRDAAMLKSLLSRLDCGERLYFDQPLGIALGSSAQTLGKREIQWLRDETPLARRILTDTAIVPPATWQPIQAKRVRYKRTRAAPPNNRPTPPTATQTENATEMVPHADDAPVGIPE